MSRHALLVAGSWRLERAARMAIAVASTSSGNGKRSPRSVRWCGPPHPSTCHDRNSTNTAPATTTATLGEGFFSRTAHTVGRSRPGSVDGMSDADHVYAERMDRVRAGMAEVGVDVLLLSLGADLPWLTGYTAMPLERLTMLVLPVDGDAVLVVPGLEAPRVEERPDVFSLRPWAETEDPVRIVADLVGARASVAISDRAWATFVLQLQALLPAASWQVASLVTGPLRAVKDADELAALRRASAA